MTPMALFILVFAFFFLLFVWCILTSTYETGKIPLRFAILPSNQLSSTRRVSTTNSPLCSDSSIDDCAWKLNLARAWPSDGFLDAYRIPSFDTICVRVRVRERARARDHKPKWWFSPERHAECTPASPEWSDVGLAEKENDNFRSQLTQITCVCWCK